MIKKSGKDYGSNGEDPGYYKEIIASIKNIKNPASIIILGPVHIIVGYPYNMNNFSAYTRNGDPLKLNII